MKTITLLPVACAVILVVPSVMAGLAPNSGSYNVSGSIEGQILPGGGGERPCAPGELRGVYAPVQPRAWIHDFLLPFIARLLSHQWLGRVQTPFFSEG